MQHTTSLGFRKNISNVLIHCGKWSTLLTAFRSCRLLYFFRWLFHISTEWLCSAIICVYNYVSKVSNVQPLSISSVCIAIWQMLSSFGVISYLSKLPEKWFLGSPSNALRYFTEWDLTYSLWLVSSILPSVSTSWPRISSLSSFMLPRLEISSTHQMANKLCDWMFLPQCMVLSCYTVVLFMDYGRISLHISSMVANDPPHWPHSNP